MKNTELLKLALKIMACGDITERILKAAFLLQVDRLGSKKAKAWLKQPASDAWVSAVEKPVKDWGEIAQYNPRFIHPPAKLAQSLESLIKQGEDKYGRGTVANALDSAKIYLTLQPAAERIRIYNMLSSIEQNMGIGVVDGVGGDKHVGEASLERNATTEEPDYIFRQSGTRWVVRYAGGETMNFEGLKGMKYIEFLLKHPGTTYLARELEQELFTEGDQFGSSLSLQEIYDEPALRELKKRMDDIRAEIAAARESNSPVDEELQRELEAIETQLNRAGEEFKNKDKRLIDSIRKNIENAKKAIGKAPGSDAKKLVEHLSAKVSTGAKLQYREEKNMIWN
jgi:hypothetical protein